MYNKTKTRIEELEHSLKIANLKARKISADASRRIAEQEALNGKLRREVALLARMLASLDMRPFLDGEFICADVPCPNYCAECWQDAVEMIADGDMETLEPRQWKPTEALHGEN